MLKLLRCATSMCNYLFLPRGMFFFLKWTWEQFQVDPHPGRVRQRSRFGAMQIWALGIQLESLNQTDQYSNNNHWLKTSAKSRTEFQRWVKKIHLSAKIIKDVCTVGYQLVSWTPDLSAWSYKIAPVISRLVGWLISKITLQDDPE